MLIIVHVFIIFLVVNPNKGAKTSSNARLKPENAIALNISKVLDKLLTNYSKSLRPNYGTGKLINHLKNKNSYFFIFKRSSNGYIDKH